MTVIAILLNCLSALLLILYGEADFNRLKNHGPYQVGYKEFRTAKLDNEVSVYYPISKAEYSAKIATQNTKWLRHGDKTLLGIAKAMGEYGSEKHGSV